MDPFALLNEPPRPWIDPEALKTRFLALSETVHPDRVHQASEGEKEAATHRYADLNAAYQVLREPKDRLCSLLELERGGKPSGIERVPEDATDLFFRVGELCRQVDAFLRERSGATSPLLKVRLFERGMEWIDRLNELQGTLHRQRGLLEDELRQMSVNWESAPPVGSEDRAKVLPLDRLEQIYRSLSYLSRWSRQCQERNVQLSIEA